MNKIGTKYLYHRKDPHVRMVWALEQGYVSPCPISAEFVSIGLLKYSTCSQMTIKVLQALNGGGGGDGGCVC